MPLANIHEFFRVSCLPKAAQVAAEWKASHVLSLLDPELDDRHLPVIPGASHVIERLRDQENAHATEHFDDLIPSIFEKMRPHLDAGDHRILVHCHAGISRSTAFTYAMIAHRAGKGQEQAAFEALLSIVNKPWPNRRIIEILDGHLGHGGKLLAPLDAMRARHPNRVNAYDRFNEKRGLFDIYARYAR